MKRRITFVPAYDHRGETPNYGQHPMHLAFVLRGGNGALVFDINTGWYPNALKREGPQYCQLVMHSYVYDPHFDPEQLCESCGFLDGEPCLAHNPYGLTDERIGKLLDTLITEGEEALWQELEKIYGAN